MPAPERTTLEQIVTAARDLVEADGLAALTMQAVAARVGVRAPSLYKRVESRDALVRLVAERTALELGRAIAPPSRDDERGTPDRGAGSRDARDSEALTPGVRTGDGDAADVRTELARVLDAFRAFAHAHPATYPLVFAPHSEQAAADPAVLAGTSEPVLELAARLAGDAHALDAARTITAWAHGFVSMERSGGFRLGGDLEQAWQFGVQHLARSLGSDED